ncbi:MAG TPA: hypothetical protein VEI02_02285 [Planctomycetota bacterium]|nr:hypothetical protein [Planctomycetota bacterium]
MSHRRIAALAVLPLLVAASLPAQCGTDDGFAGGCCTLASPVFPTFPTITLGGLGASVSDCNLDCQWNVNVNLAPVQVLCDYWIFNASFTGGTTDPSIPSALLFAKYARTWSQNTPNGPAQVWRWLVNGDLPYTFPGGPPTSFCQAPFSTLAPFGLPAHFSGHIDYVNYCGTTLWEAAIVLTHLCSYEVHGPFSLRPLPLPAGLPARTYHFVAPSNFVFGPGPNPSGTVFGDAARESRLLGGYACHTENPIVQGQLNDVFQDCYCSLPGSPGPTNFRHQNLAFTSINNCGIASFAQSVPIPGLLPTGMRFQVIGSWTYAVGGPVYPGNTTVGCYNGVLVANSLCVAPVGFNPFHGVTGVGTVGGWGAISYTMPAPAFPMFEAIDLQNILTLPNLTPGLGVPFVADHVWSLNCL